jgi:hypothetical protein
MTYGLTPRQKDAPTSPDIRWTSLSSAERVRVVREAAARGLTEKQINEETGAANGAVRVLCQRNNIRLTSFRDQKAREAIPDESEADDQDRLRERIARYAASGARRTRREQFGARA